MGEHTRQAAFKWGIEDGVLCVGRVSTLLYYISVLSGRVEHVSTLLYYMSLLSGRLEQVHRQAFSRNSKGRRMTIYARQAASKYLSCEEHMCSLLGLEIQIHKNTDIHRYPNTKIQKCFACEEHVCSQPPVGLSSLRQTAASRPYACLFFLYKIYTIHTHMYCTYYVQIQAYAGAISKWAGQWYSPANVHVNCNCVCFYLYMCIHTW